MVRIGAEDPTAPRHRCARHAGVLAYERADGVATVRLDDAGRGARPRRSPSPRAGVRLTRVEPHEPTLEDLYFAVRQRSGDSRLGTGRREHGLMADAAALATAAAAVDATSAPSPAPTSSSSPRRGTSGSRW